MEADVPEPAEIMRGLYGDGIIALAGAFLPGFADRLRIDIEALLAEAQAVPGGVLPRGPQRVYVEVQPERITGFVEIATHAWFVEIGFDIPFPGATDQPCSAALSSTVGLSCGIRRWSFVDHAAQKSDRSPTQGGLALPRFSGTAQLRLDPDRHLPAFNALLDRPEFKALPHRSDIAAMAATGGQLPAYVQRQSAIQGLLAQEVEAAITGLNPVDTALASAE